VAANRSAFGCWGCSTGQEAYSIAMAFAEAAEEFRRAPKLHVFATDLNEALLDKARHGLYARSLIKDLSPERLRRFFVEEETGYRANKQLREMIVFARQNLISDPPFSRMDLISCRNLLIYLEPGLQRKALPTFHYALKPGGLLFLGASESVVGFTNLFEPVDKHHKIYSRKAVPTPAFHLPVKREPKEISQKEAKGRKPFPLSLPLLPSVKTSSSAPAELNAQREADRVTVNQFAPPGVLINAEMEVLQFRGSTGAYLEPPKGKAEFDLLKMAREGLMLPLRAAINKAKKEKKTVRKENVRVRQNGQTRTVNVEIIPLKNLRERCFLVLFEDGVAQATGLSSGATRPAERGGRRQGRKAFGKHDASSIPAGGSPAGTGEWPVLPNATSKRRVAELEADLAETRDYLQSIQEQHEAANEELQASNEEVTSANEELQSLNEELETSKEELESANEELTTMNDELGNRNAELIASTTPSNAPSRKPKPQALSLRPPCARRATPW
jgi:two-component system CheB/CheR fusion protein